MNLFYLDRCPMLAAQMQGDKHVVKMILETAQMLSTAHRILDGEMEIVLNVKTDVNGEIISARKQKVWTLRGKSKGLIEVHKDDLLYKATHVNHPSSVWIRQSHANYEWAYRHFVHLCNEYTHRYGRVHLTYQKLRATLSAYPQNIPRNIDFKQPPCCMPDKHKITDCSVTNYRYYYGDDKKKMHKWTNREPPEWIKEFLDV